jgi:hypothetical protein
MGNLLRVCSSVEYPRTSTSRSVCSMIVKVLPATQVSTCESSSHLPVEPWPNSNGGEEFREQMVRCGRQRVGCTDKTSVLYIMFDNVYPSLPNSQRFAGGSTVSVVFATTSTVSVDLRLLVSSDVSILSGASFSESLEKSKSRGVRRGTYRFQDSGLPNS